MGSLQQTEVKKRLLWGLKWRLFGLAAARLLRKLDRDLEALEEDVATWLRVHASDLPLAWDVARKLIS